MNLELFLVWGSMTFYTLAILTGLWGIRQMRKARLEASKEVPVSVPVDELRLKLEDLRKDLRTPNLQRKLEDLIQELGPVRAVR